MRKAQHETNMQIACVRWFKYQYPKVMISSFPNEGIRSAAQGGKMKKLGLMPGMPDLVILKPMKGYGALFVELKFEHNWRVTENQKIAMEWLERSGYLVEVCRNFEQFERVVSEYLKE